MIIIDKKVGLKKKWLQWNIKSLNSYDYNQIFTSDSYFGIK